MMSELELKGHGSAVLHCEVYPDANMSTGELGSVREDKEAQRNTEDRHIHRLHCKMVLWSHNYVEPNQIGSHKYLQFIIYQLNFKKSYKNFNESAVIKNNKES